MKKKNLFFVLVLGICIFNSVVFSQEEFFESDVMPGRELMLSGEENNQLPEKTGFTTIDEEGRKIIYNREAPQVLMKDNTMEKKASAQIAQMLAQLLADEYVLYTKTYKFHWNVKSSHFGALHSFFREQYEQLVEFVDGTAERMLMIGHNAPGTLQEFSQITRLSEEPGKFPTDTEMIFILAQNHDQIIGYIRELIAVTVELDDAGTNNFLADLLEKHEKMAWMLHAHLV